jgi:hypothetical protein
MADHLFFFFFFRRKRKIHRDWVESIRYYADINSFLCCSPENQAVAIGDLERRTVRYIHVPKGVKCFDYTRKPSYIITGGPDKIMYVELIPSASILASLWY